MSQNFLRQMVMLQATLLCSKQTHVCQQSVPWRTLSEMARTAVARTAIRAVSHGWGPMQPELANQRTVPYKTPTTNLVRSAVAWMDTMAVS